MNDKSLFFLTLALCCVWLILDNFMGEKYINKFLSNMFSFVKLDTGTTETEETEKNNPEIADDNVIRTTTGTEKIGDTGINNPLYGVKTYSH